MRFLFKIQVLLALLFGLTGAGHAATIYDESISGDLSGAFGAPTVLNFTGGSNIVIGSVFAAADVRDYLTFTLGPGQSLTALMLVVYDDPTTLPPPPSNANDGNTGYHALYAGIPTGVPGGGDNPLGGNHVNPPVGVDLLPGLASGGISPGAPGFVSPLGPGMYTYVIQQTGPPVTDYTLDFVVIPVPAALPLFAAAIAGLGFVTRRRT